MMLQRFLSDAQGAAALDDASFVQAMLDFERALSGAQAEAGEIPRAAAEIIAAVCVAARYDAEQIAQEGALAGSLAIPLVRALTREVARIDAAAAGWVHWGATSQDVLDTAQALQARAVLALVDRDLGVLARLLLAQAQVQRGVPVLGRTLLQPAQVTSVDAKIEAWVAPLVRARARLRERAARALRVQLGGAVGTRAALGPRADAIAQDMARRLGLQPSDAGAWHTQRDEWIDLAAALGLAVGSLGKLARDLSLGAQGEVGEWAEGSAGGSSTMPHKRNPVGSMVALSAALRAPQRVAALLAAMPQAHERGLGDWQAELVEFAQLLAITQGAAAALRRAVQGLTFDTGRMRGNIDAQRGLVYAEGLAMVLARTLGKGAAHTRVEQWSHEALDDPGGLQAVARRAPPYEGMPGDAELAALFDAEAVARAASNGAVRRLAALAAQCDALDREPAWAAVPPPDLQEPS